MDSFEGWYSFWILLALVMVPFIFIIKDCIEAEKWRKELLGGEEGQ